ncbi:MAG: ABC transporter permease, partial [Gammaproteobacteria bacterium]|nr:ABC transporter permease [Gammaproteobacteria bacterium]
MFKRTHDIFWLAFKDYTNEWKMSGCFVLALAAVLAPMMVLFGLKVGIVGSMWDRLVEDPRNREIRPVGSGRFNPDWFQTVGDRPDVAFVIPRTRSIAATIQLKSEQAARIVRVEMIPSGKGDPLLTEDVSVPGGIRQIVVSESAARKLKVGVGDRVDGSLVRRFKGQSERVHVELEVVAVASKAAFAREGAFVALDLLTAAEDFRDGRAVPVLGWQGEPQPVGIRSFPGFRLYASSINDVASIRDKLIARGIEVRTRAADIDIVQSMDRNLTAIYWLIAVIGLIGFSFSLGASLWANVERKQRELSVLRLVGFRTGDIVWFPILQSLFTGLLGWMLASLIYLGVERSISSLLAAQLEHGQSVCRLLPEHFLAAAVFTIGAAMVAAGLGGYRAARIQPSDGL